MKTRWVLLHGDAITAFSHETDEQARARHMRMAEHRDSIFEYTDPRVRSLFAHIRSTQAKRDELNTVRVSSGKHVLPDIMAEALAGPLIPGHLPRGHYNRLSRERAALRIKCAAMLSIPLTEVPDVIAQLRRNRHFR